MIWFATPRRQPHTAHTLTALLHSLAAVAGLLQLKTVLIRFEGPPCPLPPSPSDNSAGPRLASSLLLEQLSTKAIRLNLLRH